MRQAGHSSRGVLPSVVCLKCDHEASIMKRPWPTGGLLRHKKKLQIISIIILEVSNLLTMWYVPLLPAEGCYVFRTTKVADRISGTTYMLLMFDIKYTAWEITPPPPLVLIYSRLGGSPEPI